MPRKKKNDVAAEHIAPATEAQVDETAEAQAEEVAEPETPPAPEEAEPPKKPVPISAQTGELGPLDFVFDRKELLALLKVVVPIAATGSMIPMLKALRITLKPSGLVEISATNGETTAKATAFALRPQTVALDPNEVTANVDARLLQKVVASHDGESVVLTPADTHLVAWNTKRQDRIKLTDSAGLDDPAGPSYGESPTKATLRTPLDQLAAALQSVAPAMASDSTRAVLQAVHVKKEGKRAALAATDTHRLHVAQIEATVEGDWPKDGIAIPAEFVQCLIATGGGSEEAAVEVNGQGVVRTEVGGFEIVSVLRGGAYPNYERVIPKEFKLQIGVNREEATNQLKRAALFAENKRVLFEAKQGEARIFATADAGNSEQVGVVAGEAEFRFAVNQTYMADAIAGASKPAVVVKFTEPSRPVVVEDGDYVAVVMPMALPS